MPIGVQMSRSLHHDSLSRERSSGASQIRYPGYRAVLDQRRISRPGIALQRHPPLGTPAVFVNSLCDPSGDFCGPSEEHSCSLAWASMAYQTLQLRSIRLQI